MNSLLTFCGQVLLSKATAFFYPKRFGQRLSASLLPFILISVNPFAKRKSEQNRLILLDEIILFFNVAAAYCNSTFPLCHLLRNHACSMCNVNA